MPVLPTGKALLDAEKILAKAGLVAGMTAADLGCGTIGHFTFPAARIVGEHGKVYAVDILKGALEGIESRARIESVHNVETVWGDLEREGGVRIPDGSIDMVLMVNVATLAKKTPSVSVEVKRLLKTGGKLLAVDWKPNKSGIGPSSHDRVGAEEMAKVFTKHKFVVIKEFDAGPNHWGLVLKKRSE